jgi:hypothetical protein
LGGIRMLKVTFHKYFLSKLVFINSQFMAWERSFEKRVMKVRERELKYQKMNYRIEARNLPSRSTTEHLTPL